MNNILEIENLSKQYRLGTVGTGTLSHDLNRWWHRVRGKEDPYLKIGENNDRSSKGKSEYVWALQDINLKVKEGEVLGIIGKNGAGKSTLLKVLSKVTGPTTGSIKAYGRIASLLEVGTGFHPELTGKENIYLNGAILGMRKHEIKRKFDEIVDFAGVERYIDTPVKRYSSGMYVRLAFAVAAHLEPEILVVDEVLAVGDSEFQKKALGKMKDVSQGEGRTILFVSHNMGAVSNLCDKGIVLSQGKISFEGDVSNCIENYLKDGYENISFYKNTMQTDRSKICEIYIFNREGKNIESFKHNEKIFIKYKIFFKNEHKNAVLSATIKDQKDRVIFTSFCNVEDFYSNSNEIELLLEIPSSFLVPNVYTVISGLAIVNKEVLFINSTVGFTIEETGSEFYLFAKNDYGCVNANCKWELQ